MNRPVIPALFLVGAMAAFGCQPDEDPGPPEYCTGDCTPVEAFALDQSPVLGDDGSLYLLHTEVLGTEVSGGVCRVKVELGSSGIWRCRLDGGGLEPILSGRIASMDLSPDARRMVFWFGLPGGLWLLDLKDGVVDSSSVRPIDDSGWQPLWRPDGMAIGYRYFGNTAFGDPPSGTYVMYPDSGDAPERITGEVLISDWSPDGSAIVGRIWGSSDLGIYVLADSTIRTIPGDGDHARWSPDGKCVASIMPGHGPNLLVIDLATGEARTVGYLHVAGHGAAWTPDSKSILVTRLDEYEGASSTNGTLWLVDIRSGRATAVTEAPCLRRFD